MNPCKLANPVTLTKGAFGLAGTTVGVVETVARGTVHVAIWGLRRLAPGDRSRLDDDRADSGVTTDVMNPPTSYGSTTLPVEPRAPEEPPVDVVGQALAAEVSLGDRQSPEGAGFAHEPRGASRDEEHGDAPLQRAETEVIDDEVTAALGADDEPEEHLSEPVLDPAAVNALATEMEISSRAADPNKG
jgi:hypothetical protein